MAIQATLEQLGSHIADAWRGERTPAVADAPWAKTTLTVDVSALSDLERPLAQSALQAWADVSKLTFTYTTGPADIRFAPGGPREATASQTTDASGHFLRESVRISSEFGPPVINSVLYHLYIHQIGHVLGLGHPGAYGEGEVGVPLYENDTLQWSIMSSQRGAFGEATGHVVTPQMADVWAIQSLYGANMATRLGDDTYGVGSTAGASFEFTGVGRPQAFTIYDNGGNDTLSVYRFGSSQIIDLTPGAWSSVAGGVNNVGIYVNTVVENAIGGSGADTITGNAANNWLIGGDGGDVIRGMDGDDVVLGGAGADELNGNVGSDSVVGGDGDDTVMGGKGDDTVMGDAGSDRVFGNIGRDLVFGGTGDDALFGGQDADTLYGEAGADTLSGDLGPDFLFGGAGADRFTARADGGLDWVGDFNPSEGDRILLAPGTAYTIQSYQGQVIVDLGGGAGLGLAGVTSFSADWIVYG